MYLHGVRWWGQDLRVSMSKATHVKMAKEGVDVSPLSPLSI